MNPRTTHAPGQPRRTSLTARLLMVGLASAAVAAPTSAQAIDLLESYQAALEASSDLRAARASAEAGREAEPIARAQLLPSASANLSGFKNSLYSRTPDRDGEEIESRPKYNSRTANLVVRQPLYRPGALAELERSKAVVAQSEAELAGATQDTGVKVTQAYLDLLLARESHTQLQTQLRVIGSQLQGAQQALAAGQGTRTDVDDAQARLDLTSAKEVAARDAVLQARHELQNLIQRPVDRVRAIDTERLRLVFPEPDSYQHWLDLAEQGSATLRALRSEVEARRADVERASAGHKPNVDLVFQRSMSDRDSVLNPGSRYFNNQAGVTLSVPIFAGGGVSAQTRQALAALAEGEEKLESERRRLSNEVRKQFQAVRQGVLRVRALEQAERSAQQAVISSERGFVAGTRSRLDILNAQQQLSQAALDLARERLAYLGARARLQALTGRLDEPQVRELNQSLALGAESLVGEAGAR